MKVQYLGPESANAETSGNTAPFRKQSRKKGGQRKGNPKDFFLVPSQIHEHAMSHHQGCSS